MLLTSTRVYDMVRFLGERIGVTTSNCYDIRRRIANQLLTRITEPCGIKIDSLEWLAIVNAR